MSVWYWLLQVLTPMLLHQSVTALLDLAEIRPVPNSIQSTTSVSIFNSTSRCNVSPCLDISYLHPDRVFITCSRFPPRTSRCGYTIPRSTFHFHASRLLLLLLCNPRTTISYTRSFDTSLNPQLAILNSRLYFSTFRPSTPKDRESHNTFAHTPQLSLSDPSI